MGTILGKGFPQAQVHTIHSTSKTFLLTLLTAVPVTSLSLSGHQLTIDNKTTLWPKPWWAIHFHDLTITLLSTLIYAHRYLNYTSNVTRVHEDKFDAKNASRVTKSA